MREKRELDLELVGHGGGELIVDLARTTSSDILVRYIAAVVYCPTLHIPPLISLRSPVSGSAGRHCRHSLDVATCLHSPQLQGRFQDSIPLIPCYGC